MAHLRQFRLIALVVVVFMASITLDSHGVVSALGSASTGAATDITQDGAVLNGSVTYSTSCHISVFAIGNTPDLSGTVFNYVGDYTSEKVLFIRMQGGGAPNPVEPTPQSFDLNSWSPSGDPVLHPATTYYFRMGIQEGSNEPCQTNPSCLWRWDCYVWGSVASFATRAAILPEATTGQSSLVGATTASLAASVTSNDASATVSFEYGTSSTLQDALSTNTQTVAKGTSAVSVTQALIGLDPETKYFYRVKAVTRYGTARGEIKSFETTPPVGVSINAGANYTTSKSVELSISWPVGATGISISNDGGFRAANTTKIGLTPKTNWVLDDSVSGIYTKIVYVRFDGPGIDTSRSYQDDIIFDNKPPTVTSSTAEQSGSFVVISLAAKDEESGLATVEVNNVDKTVSADYATTVLVKASDLGLGTSASSVRALGIGSLRIRIIDKAGNKTSWINLGGSTASGSGSTATDSGKGGTTAPSAVAAPSTNGSGSSRSLTLNSSVATSIVLRDAKIQRPPGGKAVMSTASTNCRLVGARLFALKTGTCVIKIRLTTAAKKTSTKTVRLSINS